MRFINNKQSFVQQMPSQSVYEATKSSIEQGIFELQEKMAKKKQLDLERELAQNILHDQRIYRQQKQILQLQQIYQNNLKYNNALLLRTTCDPYSTSLLYESALNDPTSVGYLDYLEKRRRENSDLQYLKRLDRLKEQSLALESRAINGYRAHMYDDRIKDYSSPIQEFSSHRNSPGQSRRYQPSRSPPRNQINNKKLQYDLPLEQDSSALLQKYSKGIRAQEYNRDMERLIEIEKKFRKMEHPSSSTKSHNPKGNQSIVMPYQRDNFQEANRSAQNNKQRSNANSHHHQNNKIKQEQRTIVNKQPKEASQLVQKPLEQHKQIQQKSKAEIFENQKIGKVINKRKVQEIPKDQQPDLEHKYPALDKLDNYIKKAQNRSPFTKPVSLNRPFTSKSRNHGYRQASRSLTSAVSPLKSQRAHNRHPYVGKLKRPRAKSSKPHNSSRNYNNNVSIKAKQINSRLLALDPCTQKVFQDILRKQINEKIQNRLQLLTCVFKDAKLRHQRNQVEALLHRFDIEAKARKQVKNIINNHPKILRKHKMVVE